MTHPVQFRVEPSRMHRAQVAVRLVVLAALGAVGCSSLYWALYLALPAFAALLVSRDGKQRFLGEDASAVLRGLRWFASAYAYLWLLTDAMPTTDADRPVELKVSVCGQPTVVSALCRLGASVPAVLVLAIVSAIAILLWIVGAMMVVATEHMPAWIADFIAMKLRYQFRLVAYHMSIVDAYPMLVDPPQAHAPPARAH